MRRAQQAQQRVQAADVRQVYARVQACMQSQASRFASCNAPLLQIEMALKQPLHAW
jgi:hypothetical protein